MTKMTKGAVNRLRVAGMLFYGEPGNWQTTDSRFEVIRDHVSGEDGELCPVWGVWDNGESFWVEGTDATEFATMRDAVHYLKSYLAQGR